MRNKTIGLLILILGLSSCLKNSDEMNFDYQEAVGEKMRTWPDFSYFDFSRDSLMEFEVVDNFSGALIGTESWVKTKDSVFFSIRFAWYQITRKYVGDNRQFVRQFYLDNNGALLIREGIYDFPLINSYHAINAKKDTSFANYLPGSGAGRYRMHYPAKRDYYDGELLFAFRGGIDSIPAIGSTGPGQEKREDFYFVQTLGLWEMRESYFHIENGETEYARLTKTRIR